MKKKIIPFLLGFCLFIIPVLASGQNLLIKNGTILTVTKGTIPGGDILIIDGVIKQIGKSIEAPEGVKTVDATGKYVIPGIIDSHTHIAITAGNESSEAITPEVSVRDVLNAEDTAIYTALSGGVTMVHTMHGSGNPIGGQNIVQRSQWEGTNTIPSE